MRDFSNDHFALALNTATLGHNVDGHGAGWPVERVIDACAERGFGGIVFWRREIGRRGVEIGGRARAAGLAVAGLCRRDPRSWTISAPPSTWRRNLERRS
jgi:hypothetical protein